MKDRKKRLLLLLGAALVAVLALVFWRKFSAQKGSVPTSSTATAPSAAAAGANAAANQVELAATDVLQAQVQSLPISLPFSGNIVASQSAMVKAKAAGELLRLDVRVGDRVRKGQVLGQIDSEDVDLRTRQSQESRTSAQAQLDTAQRQYDNNRALVEQGFISKTALEASANAVSAARAAVRSAEAGLGLALKSKGDTALRAPITGTVAARYVQPGERVGVDTRVLDLVGDTGLEVEAALAPADLAQARPGQSAEVQVNGLAESGFTARLVRISPVALSGSRNTLVYLALPEHSALRPGLFAQGRIAVGSVSGVVLPLSAVRSDKAEPYVIVVQNQRIAEQVVRLGQRSEVDGKVMVLLDGLAAGSTVVAGHIGSLRVGAAVRQAVVPAVPAVAPAISVVPAATVPAAAAAPAAPGLR